MAGDILDVKRRLADRAQAVAEMLLPAGRREGQEWRAGSVDGERGKSLGVHLSGTKAGIWMDFGDPSKGGDLLDLWREVKRIPLVEALDQARAWLGISRPAPYRDPKPVYVRPPKPACGSPSGRVTDYLIEERNIPGHVLAAYKIGGQGDKIIFPFLLPDGTLALAKSREAVDGASPRPTAANCEPVLFGWQAVPPDAREIIITEGEIDALSWAAYGQPAMSVPFGGGKGGKQSWIENEFERLDQFEHIYISTDMDKPGDEAAEEIASRLGRHRCYRVKLPHKDANDCLVAGIPGEDMARFLAQAAALDPDGLRSASDFHDEVVRLFWPGDGERTGYSTPFGKLDGKLCFRPGEVTLWSGASGSGKSQIISDCVPHWVREGSRICLSSLEMKGAQTLRRMVKQAGGVERPTEPYIAEVLAYLDRGLLLYDRTGKAGVEGLLDVFDYARAKYGCDQFIIDSLMRLGVAGDDYTGQERVMFLIVEWAISNSVHVHLVAHARKGDRGHGAPNTEDIKGAMEIGANAFNIVTIWRNRELEEEARVTSSQGAKPKDEPGVVLNVAKQRNGDFEGRIGLWFDQTTYGSYSSFDRSLWGRRNLDDRTDAA